MVKTAQLLQGLLQEVDEEMMRETKIHPSHHISLDDMERWLHCASMVNINK